MVIEIVFLSTELDILDLRLNSLDDLIDKVIIVEYPFNHSRKPCTMYYNENKERFKKFHHKIIHVIDDNQYMEKDYPRGSSGLGLMWNRRGSSIIMDALSFCKDDDFIFGFDGDAILNRETLLNFDLTKPTTLAMKWCMYWFNWYSITSVYDWSVAAPFHILKSVGRLSSLVGYQPPPDVKINYVSNAGWHFSKCGGVEKLIENIKGYPHQEFKDNPALIDPIQVQARINNGWAWNDYTNGKNGVIPNMKLDPYDPKDYPDYLNEHPEIFSKYFKGGMILD